MVENGLLIICSFFTDIQTFYNYKLLFKNKFGKKICTSSIIMKFIQQISATF